MCGESGLTDNNSLSKLQVVGYILAAIAAGFVALGTLWYATSDDVKVQQPPVAEKSE